MSSVCIRAAPQPVSVLFLGAGGCGLPTLACLCEALPNIEKVLRPIRQKAILEFTPAAVKKHDIPCRPALDMQPSAKNCFPPP